MTKCSVVHILYSPRPCTYYRRRDHHGYLIQGRCKSHTDIASGIEYRQQLVNVDVVQPGRVNHHLGNRAVSAVITLYPSFVIAANIMSAIEGQRMDALGKK